MGTENLSIWEMPLKNNIGKRKYELDLRTGTIFYFYTYMELDYESYILNS